MVIQKPICTSGVLLGRGEVLNLIFEVSHWLAIPREEQWIVFDNI